jgi:hypothetical protein
MHCEFNHVSDDLAQIASLSDLVMISKKKRFYTLNESYPGHVFFLLHDPVKIAVCFLGPSPGLYIDSNLTGASNLRTWKAHRRNSSSSWHRIIFIQPDSQGPYSGLEQTAKAAGHRRS